MRYFFVPLCVLAIEVFGYEDKLALIVLGEFDLQIPRLGKEFGLGLGEERAICSTLQMSAFESKGSAAIRLISSRSLLENLVSAHTGSDWDRS